MAKSWTKGCWRHMIVVLVPSYGVNHQRSHHMVRKCGNEVDRRLHGGTMAMNRSIWRMQSLYVVKIVWNCPHLHHSLSVIRCKAFYLRAPDLN
jgi:hypothetical protein